MSRIFSPVARPLDSVGREILTPEKVIETRGLWSNGTGELFTFFTSSLQNTSSREYYYEFFQSLTVMQLVLDLYLKVENSLTHLLGQFTHSTGCCV